MERYRERTNVFHLLGQFKKKTIVILIKYIVFAVMETGVLEKHGNSKG